MVFLGRSFGPVAIAILYSAFGSHARAGIQLATCETLAKFTATSKEDSYAGGAASGARGELCPFFLSFDRLFAIASGSNKCFGNWEAISSMSK